MFRQTPGCIYILLFQQAVCSAKSCFTFMIYLDNNPYHIEHQTPRKKVKNEIKRHQNENSEKASRAQDEEQVQVRR